MKARLIVETPSGTALLHRVGVIIGTKNQRPRTRSAHAINLEILGEDLAKAFAARRDRLVYLLEVDHKHLNPVELQGALEGKKTRLFRVLQTLNS